MAGIATRARNAASTALSLSSYRMLMAMAVEPMEPMHEVRPLPPPAQPTDAALRELGASGAIPPILFQTWKSRSDLPANYSYWRSSFFRLNPDFQILLWDDADNRRFIAEHYPAFLTQYDFYPQEIYRADLVRLFFLLRYGGFYADMDSECIRPLQELKIKGDVVLGRMGKDDTFPHSIPNAIMASKPGQFFWLVAIALAIEQFRQCEDAGKLSGPDNVTGPVLLKRAVDLYNTETRDALIAHVRAAMPDVDLTGVAHGTVEVLPRDVFYPIDWTNAAHQAFRKRLHAKRAVLSPARAQKLFDRATIVTYWSASWKTP